MGSLGEPRAPAAVTKERLGLRGHHAATRKLLVLGASALSDEELWSVAFRSGVIARRASCIPLSALMQTPLETVSLHSTLHVSRGAQLAAFGELHHRASSRAVPPRYIRRAADVHALVLPHVRGQRKELILILALDASSRVIHLQVVARGDARTCRVPLHDVLRTAIVCRGTGVVLVHNHPSGRPQPSAEDVAMTRQLSLALRLVNVALVDHVVVTDTEYFSFAEHEQLISERAQGPPPG